MTTAIAPVQKPVAEMTDEELRTQDEELYRRLLDCDKSRMVVSLAWQRISTERTERAIVARRTAK